MSQKREVKRNAPYASAAAVSELLDHIRYVSTPKKVDPGLLTDYGVSKGNTFALMSALKFLGLIDNAGVPTPAFSSLQTMGDEFRSNLREIVEKAYADLFSRLDVTRDSREHIRNYFARNYSASQADKATTLFLDLCREAGIPVAEELAKETRRTPVARSAPTKTEERSLSPPHATARGSATLGDLREAYLRRLIESDLDISIAPGMDAEAIREAKEMIQDRHRMIMELLKEVDKRNTENAK